MPAIKRSKNKQTLPPVKDTPITASLTDVRTKIEALGLIPADIEVAVKWARH